MALRSEHIWSLQRIWWYPVCNQSKGMSGRRRKSNRVWWWSSSWASGKVRLQVFLFWSERDWGPSGWAAQGCPDTDSLSTLTAAILSSRLSWGTALALQLPCFEYSNHTRPAPPLPKGGFDSFTTCAVILKQETHEEMQRHKSVVSIPDKYHDQKSQIPEVTSSAHPDRIWGLSW